MGTDRYYTNIFTFRRNSSSWYLFFPLLLLLLLLLLLPFFVFFFRLYFLSRRFSPQVGNNRPQPNENLVNSVLFSFHHASFTRVSLRHEDEEGGRKERRIIKLGEGWTRDVVGARLSKYRKYIITLPKWHVVTWSDCISLWPTACSTGSRRRANSPRTCLPWNPALSSI